MSLPEHLEKFLGTVRGGWSQTADGRRMEFTVVDFAGGSRLNEHAFATLGLSKIPLHSPSHTEHIYQELVIVVPETLGLVPVPDTLQHVAQEAVATGQAVVRGNVIGPRGPLFYDDSKMEALYAANPWIFPNEFATYRDEKRIATYPSCGSSRFHAAKPNSCAFAAGVSLKTNSLRPIPT